MLLRLLLRLLLCGCIILLESCSFLLLLLLRLLLRLLMDGGIFLLESLQLRIPFDSFVSAFAPAHER